MGKARGDWRGSLYVDVDVETRREALEKCKTPNRTLPHRQNALSGAARDPVVP